MARALAAPPATLATDGTRASWPGSMAMVVPYTENCSAWVLVMSVAWMAAHDCGRTFGSWCGSVSAR